MKRSELKGIVKECIKEILFEEGVLSNLVAEVAFGISKAQGQLLENTPAKPPAPVVSAEDKEAKRKKLLETKRKMLDAIGNKKMNGVFEGTAPLSSAGSPGQSSGTSPLSGKDPTDAGIDISGLFGLAGKKWQQLK